MDVKLPIANQLPAQLPSGSSALSGLQIGQSLNATVAKPLIDTTTLTLEWLGKTLMLQADRPLTLLPGRALTLQVVQLQPQPSFKLIEPPIAQTASVTGFASSNPTPIELTLLSTAGPSPAASTPLSLAALPKGRAYPAQVVATTPAAVTFQLGDPEQPPPAALANPSPNPLPAPAGLLTVAKSQLNWTAAASGNAVEQAAMTTAKRGTTLPAVFLEQPLLLEKTGSSTAPRLLISLPPVDIDNRINQALRSLLPMQQALPVLLTTLRDRLPDLEHHPQVAEVLKQMAREIWQALPRQAALAQAQPLKQTVQQSGLFLEARLAQDGASGPLPATVVDDFKLKLLKLFQSLHRDTPLPDRTTDGEADTMTDLLQDLLQKTQGSLAKLTVNQLLSQPVNPGEPQVWLMDIPFINHGAADTVQLKIERDAQGREQTDTHRWSVSITVTPPGLGTIHCKIACYDQTVNTRFWSERDDTVDKIAERLDYLRQQFENNGLTPGFMGVQHGKPAESNTPLPSRSLFQAKA